MMQPFVSVLGTELALTSKEIADIIWLAIQMQGSGEGMEVATQLEQSKEGSLPLRTTPTPPQTKPDLKPQVGSAEVHLNQPTSNQAGFGNLLALMVPDARSLREPLSLARSLKPLLRRIVCGSSKVLDETATVERIINEQLWLPILKPALEPWLDLALVVDESDSMQLWQRTIAELQRLLSNYGVFRDVRIWGLVTDERGQAQLHPGIGIAAQRGVARHPRELIDPSGRRLILVATDCVSYSWQDGSLLTALKVWAKSGSVAIIQMLPEWLWSRTGLGFASAVKLRSILPGVMNQQLIAKDLSIWDDVDLDAGTKVPVVTLEPDPFITWAEMVVGKGGAWSPGFVFEPEAVPPRRVATRLNGVIAEDSAEHRIQRFRVTASPMARRLAGLLAATPVITLPVVRIIQDQLLPESRQVHVAEVFLGGLLKPLEEVGVETSPDARQYDFLDGVREILLESVPTSDSINVLEEISKFIAERLGLSLNSFKAVLRNPVQVEDQELICQTRPFAMVAAKILRQLGGEYERLAEELECSTSSAESDILIPSKTMSVPGSHPERQVARIFVSYKHGEEPYESVVKAVVEALSQQHQVFDDQMIIVGTNWAKSIEVAIRQADYLITFLSDDSVNSEMVKEEIETAYQFNKTHGKPKILPVRLSYRDPFSYPLSAYLNGLNWASWDSPTDTPKLIEELKQAIAGSALISDGEIQKTLPLESGALPKPSPSAQPTVLELPEGSMDPESQFYVERAGDEIALGAIRRRGVTITIKGPRQMGKSSLLLRTVDAAIKSNKRVVFLDFQLLDQEVLENADRFYRQLCTVLTEQLDLPDRVAEFWQDGLGNNQRCTRYLQNYVLRELNSSLVLAMDEVDRIFDREFRSDFFSMLRSWHNNRASPLPALKVWKQFDLVLVTATEPYSDLIADLNQSPFNVGEVVMLTDFTTNQVADLNRLHRSPLTTAQERQLMGLLHGHPYLVRKALYLVASKVMSMGDLFTRASQDGGPFADHLSYHLFRINDRPELAQGLLEVIRNQTCEDKRIARLLNAVGLVRYEKQAVLPRCQLYADYFRERLSQI
jgi:hypothetical protein